MNIGIIGIGNVGGTLGRRWGQIGHTIAYGVREPNGEKARAVVAASGPGARAVAPAAAAAFGEVVLIALPFKALEEALPGLGDLTGKVVIGGRAG